MISSGTDDVICMVFEILQCNDQFIYYFNRFVYGAGIT